MSKKASTARVLMYLALGLFLVALALKQTGLAFQRPPVAIPIPAALHGGPQERFLELRDDELDGVLLSSGFSGLDEQSRGRAIAEAARRDRLHFATPTDAVGKIRGWYPEYRVVGKPIRGELLPPVNGDWSPEGVALFSVWQCWPEAASSKPDQDPLLSPGKSAWPTDLGACMNVFLARRATPAFDEAARKKLAAEALPVLRQKIAAALRNTTCREKGADDCGLLLLELASIAPSDAVLADALARVEQQLASSPDLDHAYRRFAIARAKVAMALAAMASFTTEAPLHLRLLDAAEERLPRAVLWLRAKAGLPPAPAVLPEETVRKILVGALDAHLAMHRLAEAERAKGKPCCLLEANGHLRPLDPIEDAGSADVRERAVAYLSDEVKRRAGQAACDEGLAGLGGESLLSGERRYTLGGQLALAYAVERARRADQAACGPLALPQKDASKPWLVDVEGMLSGLLADEQHPRAHAEAERLLAALCADLPESPRCASAATAPESPLSEDMLVDGTRFVSQAVAAERSALAKQLPGALADLVLARVDAAQCRTQSLTLWTHAKRNVVVVEPNCVPTGQPERPIHALIVARDKSASWVSVSPGFMQQDRGRLLAVTDLDDDGRPELWFKGIVSECDGEAGKQPTCDPEGIEAKEVAGNGWMNFTDERLRTGQRAMKATH
jgi:hypothetical protein